MNKVCDKFCSGIRPYNMRKIAGITISFLGAGFILLFTYDYPVARYGIIAIFCIVTIIKHRAIIVFAKQVISTKES